MNKSTAATIVGLAALLYYMGLVMVYSSKECPQVMPPAPAPVVVPEVPPGAPADPAPVVAPAVELVQPGPDPVAQPELVAPVVAAPSTPHA